MFQIKVSSVFQVFLISAVCLFVGDVSATSFAGYAEPVWTKVTPYAMYISAIVGGVGSFALMVTVLLSIVCFLRRLERNRAKLLAPVIAQLPAHYYAVNYDAAGSQNDPAQSNDCTNPTATVIGTPTMGQVFYNQGLQLDEEPDTTNLRLKPLPKEIMVLRQSALDKPQISVL